MFPHLNAKLRVICLANSLAMQAVAIHAQSPATTGDAPTVLAAAREALGGEKRIAGVKTLVATGRTRQLQGENLVPIEFEINIELPDKYTRTDEIPARESGLATRGFNGSDLIQLPVQAAPSGRGGGAAAADGTTPLRQDFARLTLGMFAMSFPSYPLTFSYGGSAEAPEGKADVIDVKAPANFSGRLFIHSQTHLPLMFSWTVPPILMPVLPGQPPPANLPPGTVTFEAPGPPPGPASTVEDRQKYQQDLQAARAKAMQQTKAIENRIYYADYREVNGLKLPFRVRRAVGATTIEETVFDRYRINAKIDPKKFEVRR